MFSLSYINKENLSFQTAADLQRILNETPRIGESQSNKFDKVTEEEKISFKSTEGYLMQTNRKNIYFSLCYQYSIF